MSQTHRLPAKGYSLIELLTAIAVLAILAGVLIVTLMRVRDAGHTTQCASNLRQMGMAYLLLTSDRQGNFPSSRLQNAWDPSTQSTVLAKGGFAHDMLRDYIPNPVSLLNSPGAKPEDAGVYWCPGRDPSSTSLTMTGGQGPVYSYAHNVSLGSNRALPNVTWTGPESAGPNDNYHPGLANIMSVPEPSLIIIFMDHTHPGNSSAGHLLESTWPLMRNPPSTPPAAGRQVDFTRHGGYANAVFLDGSVRRLDFEDLAGTRSKYLVPER